MARDWKTSYAAQASAATPTANSPATAVASRTLLATGIAPTSVDPGSTDPDLEPIPGAYATIGQLKEHLGRTPADARQLLLRASRAVDRVTLCAIYDPTAPKYVTALREAVLEQIAVGLEQGDITASGGRRGGGFTIGKISVQPTAAADRATQIGGLWSTAWDILQQAGLTGHGPIQR